MKNQSESLKPAKCNLTLEILFIGLGSDLLLSLGELALWYPKTNSPYSLFHFVRDLNDSKK